MADDFGGGEITTPTIDSAGAEAAAVSAPDLAGDTESQAGATVSLLTRSGGNENRLDERAIAQFPQKFTGGIFRSLDGDGFGGTEPKAGGKGGAEGEREVGHLVIGGDESLQDPGTNLLFAVGLVGWEIPRGYWLIEEERKHIGLACHSAIFDLRPQS